MKKLLIIVVAVPLAGLTLLTILSLGLMAVGYEAPEEPVKTTVTETEDPTTGAKESSRREEVKPDYTVECQALANTVKVAKANKKFWFAEERRLYANDTYDCGL